MTIEEILVVSDGLLCLSLIWFSFVLGNLYQHRRIQEWMYMQWE